MRAFVELLLTLFILFCLFRDRREALATLPSHPADCLLLDLNMPEVNGFDVLETFAEQHVTTPVVVLTGHTEAGTAERVLAFGASPYLLKPVDEAALVSAIESAITDADERRQQTA